MDNNALVHGVESSSLVMGITNRLNCVTDTTDDVASANSLIKAGYTLYTPAQPWALSNSLYWRKWLCPKC
jgi:hypothetical protein